MSSPPAQRSTILTTRKVHLTESQPGAREVKQDLEDAGCAVVEVKRDVVTARGKSARPGGGGTEDLLVETGGVGVPEVHLQF